MSKNPNSIRTYPIRNLVIFVAIAFLISLGMIILMIFLQDEMMVIRVLVWILCGIFTIASAIILVQQLFFYIEVDDEYFIKHVLFTKQKIAFRRIEKLVNNDGFYDIYVDKKKISSIPTNTKESQQIIVMMEKKGVKIEW